MFNDWWSPRVFCQMQWLLSVSLCLACGNSLLPLLHVHTLGHLYFVCPPPPHVASPSASVRCSFPSLFNFSLWTSYNNTPHWVNVWGYFFFREKSFFVLFCFSSFTRMSMALQKNQTNQNKLPFQKKSTWWHTPLILAGGREAEDLSEFNVRAVTQRNCFRKQSTPMNWREGLTVKWYCSCKGPRFGFQYSHLGDAMPSSALCWYLHRWDSNTHKHVGTHTEIFQTYSGGGVIAQQVRCLLFRRTWVWSQHSSGSSQLSVHQFQEIGCCLLTSAGTKSTHDVQWVHALTGVHENLKAR